jgi:hypothetical protein
MTSHHRTLGMVYDHPTSHNIEWKDVIHMLNQLGTTEHVGHDGLKATVNGKTVVFHGTHYKTLNDEQVREMRKYLYEVGLQPEQPAKKGP